MSWLNTHIKVIQEATEQWLAPENNSLQKAIKKTVEEGLFSRPDIEFQLEVLRENIQNDEIREWVDRSGLNDQQNAKGKKVLCLHAGNLPLVGFQTALGTILSGAEYYGKLSRKDPYLLASFLHEINRLDLEQSIDWSTELFTFQQLKADAVIFAGSEESVPKVKNEVIQLQAAKNGADYLIRTAKLSIAYIDTWSPVIRDQLVEAMLRYAGQGCRSVGIVVANFDLNVVKEELAAAINTFWKENPQNEISDSSLNYQQAYNQAIERQQLWLKDFLIQESEELPDTDFTVNWVKGDESTVKKLRSNNSDRVQTVYTTSKQLSDQDTDPLEQAQRPPLYWQPDGKDVIMELMQ